ncbi:hypothetical protein MMC10_000639 [Thelotrema lepadinum]|nr:hypothetical protein [Thelotrema lepadinum]
MSSKSQSNLISCRAPAVDTHKKFITPHRNATTPFRQNNVMKEKAEAARIRKIKEEQQQAAEEAMKQERLRVKMEQLGLTGEKTSKKATVSSNPPRASFMGLPIELRLSIYDYLLPTELYMFKTTMRGYRLSVSIFRALFTTSHAMRSEIMWYCLLGRVLCFDFTTRAIHYFLTGFEMEVMQKAFDELGTLKSQEVGPHVQIRLCLTGRQFLCLKFEIFGDLDQDSPSLYLCQ